MSKQATPFLLSFLLVGVVSLASFTSAQSRQESQNLGSSKFVRVERPETGDGYRKVRRYTGVVAARRTSALSFLRSGRVEKIFVEEGAELSQGQLLAVLDTRALVAERERLRAQLARARARYQELERGPRREPRLGSEAEVRRLASELRLAQQKLERRRALYRDGAIPKEELDEWESRVRATEESLEAARQDSLELENGTRSEVLAQAAADVSEVEAALSELEVRFEDSELHAPFPGRVASRTVDEGTVISAGSPLVLLDESGPSEALVDLPADVNPPPEVRLIVGERELPGTLLSEPVRVDQESFTRTARYKIPASTPGSPVVLELTRFVEEPGLWVPTSSLTAASNGLWRCYSVNEKSRVDVHQVEVLYREPERVLVRGTLRPHDRVVVEGVKSVVPGQHVAL